MRLTAGAKAGRWVGACTGALMAAHQHALAERAAGEADLAEVAERRVENAGVACLKRPGRSEEEAVNQPKAAAWKAAIAAPLRAISTVKNPWLAGRLHMGDPEGVSRSVGELRKGQRPEAAELLRQITDIRV